MSDRNCPYCALDIAVAYVGPCIHKAKGVVLRTSSGFMAAVDPCDGHGLWPKMVGPFRKQAHAQKKADALASDLTAVLWDVMRKAKRKAEVPSVKR